MTTTLLPRRAWTSEPAAAPALLVPSEVRGLAVHWDGPPVPAAVERADRDAVALFLRGVRRFHMAPPRGWSDIAYQFAVDQAGRRWELRGWTRRSGANGDTDPNRHYGAVVALIGEGQTPTPAMLAGLADARADFRRHYPRATALRTHNDVRPDPTACPGPDLTRWVRAGGPNTPREDTDMTVDDLVAALKDEDGKLTVWLKRRVREAVQDELAQERAGVNPGQ